MPGIDEFCRVLADVDPRQLADIRRAVESYDYRRAAEILQQLTGGLDAAEESV